MSISLMTQAWKIQGLSITQKVVLLSLADNANDQGECYPSIAQIVGRTGASERTVQAAIRALEGLGYVRSMSRLGTSTIYMLTLDKEASAVIHSPRKSRTPAESAPPQISHHTPAEDTPPPPQQMHPTPANAAPKPSINRQLNRHGTVKEARKRATPIPADFEISERVRNWAFEKGHQNLDAHLEHFIGLAKAKGYTYMNWDEALMNAIRANWAKLPAVGTISVVGGKQLNKQEALEQRNFEIGQRWATGGMQ